MASAPLSHWISQARKKDLKHGIARNSRFETRILLGKVKNGALDPDDMVFMPYRHNKNNPYYD